MTPFRGGGFRKRKRRKCLFTLQHKRPYYLDLEALEQMINDKNRIIPRRISGVSARNQRLLTKAIKQARFMALLPYTTQGV